MSEVSEHTSIRRQPRQMMLVAAIVAGVPMVCQILALIAMAVAPAGSFPAADRAVTDLRFWPIQIVMLCIALAGNAVVSCVRSVWETSRTTRATVCFLLWLLLAFFVESLMFSVALLASRIGWV